MAISLSGMERHVLAVAAVCVAVMAVLHEVMQLKEIGGIMEAQYFEGAEDYYAVLGVKDTSTQQEIETAYKRATSQFHSRNLDDDLRKTRAKIVTAHEQLSNKILRDSYDKRRRIVTYVGMAIKGALIAVVLAGAILANMKLLRFLSSKGFTAAMSRYLGIALSFEAKLRRSLKKVHISVEVTLNRDNLDARLGMELLPPRPAANGMIGLEVANVVPGGVADSCNQAIRAARLGEAEPLTWWSSSEVHAGDVITSVNGASRPEKMMEEMKSSTSLRLTMHRSLLKLLPWIVEVDLSRQESTERWGCQLGVAADSSDTLEVSTDEFSGALQRWNEANLALKVRRGDRIVAVNRDFRVQNMSQHMKNPAALASKWLIVRGAFADTTVPSEVVCGPFRKTSVNDKLGIRIGNALDKPVHGHVIEAGAAEGVTVVKEVRAGYVVDTWNTSGCGPKVEVGAAVISVNNKTDPSVFASELSKHIVSLRLRPVRGSKVVPMETMPGWETPLAGGQHLADGGSDSRPSSAGPAVAPAASETAAARLLPLRLDAEEEPPFIFRLLSWFIPSRWFKRSFEVCLRSSLAKLRCEFNVEVNRGEGDKLGLNLQPARDSMGGFVIAEIDANSLIGEHNLRVTGRNPAVQISDRLVQVNGRADLPGIVEEVKNQSNTRLQLRFSRKAAEAAPGVWEAEVERRPDEGWGMELKEHVPTGGRPGSGCLRIEGIQPGGAVDRWNTVGSGAGSSWVIEPGDWIVAAAPAVGHNETVKKLKASHQVRLTLLRWHAGPAPGAYVADPTALHFQVTLKRAPTDKLGVCLNPSDWDPTRTVIAEIMPGGLVQRHNTAVMAAGGRSSTDRGQEVQLGDEVESINGESDHSRFHLSCQASELVLQLTRRGAATPQDTEPELTSPLGSSGTPVAATPALATVAMPLPVATMPSAVDLAPPQASVQPKIPLPEVPDAKATQPQPMLAQRAVTMPAPASIEADSASAETGPAAGSAPTANGVVDHKTARENFLLKSEIEQLKRQIATGPGAGESSLKDERNRLLMDCEHLKAQNAALISESERVERRESRLSEELLEARSPKAADASLQLEALCREHDADATSQIEALRHKHDAEGASLREEHNAKIDSLNRDHEAQISALRRERAADQADFRSQQAQTKAEASDSNHAAIQQSNELAKANQRLEGENGRLCAQVAQLTSSVQEATARASAAATSREADQRLESENGNLRNQVAQLTASLNEAMARASAATSREASPLEVTPTARLPLRQQLPTSSLEGLGDGLTRLQELSASLEHVLSCNPDLSSSHSAGSAASLL